MPPPSRPRARPSGPQRTLPLAAALLALLLAGGAWARKVSGVELAEAVTVEGRQLQLNGAGVRRKLWFDAYVGGLYLEAPHNDPEQVVRSSQYKRLELVFARSVDHATLARTVRGGFEKNNAEQMPELRERLERLLGSIPSIKRGERLVLDFVPGTGVVARHRGAEMEVEGDDFARALLRVWFGPRAPNDSLRKGLLGLE